MRRVVVADASPVIALLAIGQLDLLRQLFGEILVTPEVRTEIHGELPLWVSVMQPGPVLATDHYGVKLDAGESSAIYYSENNHVDLVLMDERKGRSVCGRLNIPVLGTVGVIQDAKRAGIIPLARPLINALVADGLFLSQIVVDRALAEVGE